MKKIKELGARALEDSSGKTTKASEATAITSRSSKSLPAEDYYEELSDNEVRFLRSYAECCSVEQASRDAGLHLAQTKKFIRDRPCVVREMKMMQSAFRAQWRLSAAQAAGKHVQLMDKAEALLEQGEVKALASLAKMSEASLKATGHFDQADQQAATNVSVSINIGSVEAGASVSVELPSAAASPQSESPSFIDITPEEETSDEGS